MKRTLPLSLTIFMLSTLSSVPLVRASDGAPNPSSEASSAASASGATQSIDGRIVKLDLKTGVFSVRNGTTNQIVELKAGPDVNVKSLRRGERVTVTYSGNTASNIKGNRSAK